MLGLHRGVKHPHQDKLLNLLRRARPADLDPQTRSILREISESCDICQRLGPEPILFKATLPSVDDIIFGEELSIDLMFIDSEVVLHVVDTATRFSAATFLKEYGQSVEGIWLAFIEAWCTIYTGYPNRLRTDAGSVFTSPRWKYLTDMSRIELRVSAVEAHNSLGIGERLHAPLRHIYRKIKSDFAQISPGILVNVAVKATNDTNGENDLVPSLLVFGIVPRFPIISSHLPTHRERMEALSEAQMEMNAIISERRVSKILHRNIRQATDRVYQAGEVLVYREGPDQWMVPFIVSKVEDKLVTVLEQNKMERTFSIQQIKPYNRLTSSSDTLDSSEFLNEMLSPFQSGSSPKLPPRQTFMTEVIQYSDPRADKFVEAKKKKIQSLIDRKTWRVVLKRDVSVDANVLGGRFVLAIKDEGTQNEVWKAIFVVQGYRDKPKTSRVHNNPNVKTHSVRLLIGLASALGFHLFSIDVTQAYLQSADRLMRNVYLKPSKEFGLAPDKLLKLQKPLYGLAGSGDYWGKTLSEHLLKCIGMKTTLGGGDLFYTTMENFLSGLRATFVAEILQAGNDGFSDLVKKTEEKFQCKSRNYDNVQFAGIEIETNENGFHVHQKSYLSKLPILEKHSSFKQFRSLHAKLSRAVNSRPDIACAVA